jgi:hypothetical protein
LPLLTPPNPTPYCITLYANLQQEVCFGSQTSATTWGGPYIGRFGLTETDVWAIVSTSDGKGS